jgi:hypothetical protein
MHLLLLLQVCVESREALCNMLQLGSGPCIKQSDITHVDHLSTDCVLQCPLYKEAPVIGNQLFIQLVDADAARALYTAVHADAAKAHERKRTHDLEGLL